MRKIAIWTIGVLVGLGLIGLLVMRIPAVQDRIFEGAVMARAGTVHSEMLGNEAMHLVFCGTGSPMPDPERGAACVGVLAGGHFFLVDTGAGAAERLTRYQVPMGALDGVIFTHFHSDHISGLYEVTLQSWAGGRHRPLDLYGPVGVQRIADGYREAFALDASYRTAHHGAEVMPPVGATYQTHVVPLADEADSAVVFDQDGLKITAFRVAHEPIDPAYGYRFDYKGRSVIFSGDTVKHPNIARFGKDAEVMVHEALAGPMVETLAKGVAQRSQATAKILLDTLNYHTSPVEAAESANEAGAQLLVYSHIVPPLPNQLAESMFLRGVSEVRPEGVLIGWDGLWLELPIDSREIIHRDLR